jgi:NADH-quinone oxidoreductase subunit L
MGRLFGAMPQTAIVFLVGTFALAGIPPFVGFFSKEAVLIGVWEGGLIGPFLMLVLTVLLTACYMFRVVFLAFFGGRQAEGRPHDPPAVMAGPNWLLAGLALGLGVLFAFASPGEAPHAPGWLTALSIGLALAGIALAWIVYQRRAVSPAALAAAFGPLHRAAERKYWLDDFYAGLYRSMVLALSRLIGLVDRYLVDGLVNVASAWTLRWGDRLRMIQTGQAQDYLYGVAFGLLIVIIWSQWR